MYMQHTKQQIYFFYFLISFSSFHLFLHPLIGLRLPQLCQPLLYGGNYCYVTSLLAGPISSDFQLLLTILSLREKIATVCLQQMVLCSISEVQRHILKNQGRPLCKNLRTKNSRHLLQDAGFKLGSPLKTILRSACFTSELAGPGKQIFLFDTENKS